GQTLMKFGPPHPRPGAPPSFFVLDSTTHLFDDIQGADAAPTPATKAAAADLETKVGPIMDAWRKLLESDLPALNQQLKQAGFPEDKTGATHGLRRSTPAATTATAALWSTRRALSASSGCVRANKGVDRRTCVRR